MITESQMTSHFPRPHGTHSMPCNKAPLGSLSCKRNQLYTLSQRWATLPSCRLPCHRHTTYDGTLFPLPGMNECQNPYAKDKVMDLRKGLELAQGHVAGKQLSPHLHQALPAPRLKLRVILLLLPSTVAVMPHLGSLTSDLPCPVHSLLPSQVIIRKYQ